MIHWKVLLATTAAVAGIAGGALPAQAAAPMSECHWKVHWETAGVFENPGDGSPIKLKHRGDIVGPYCATAEHTAYLEYGQWMQEVRTDRALDGNGWMRADALVPA